jgi:hypothetical protein
VLPTPKRDGSTVFEGLDAHMSTTAQRAAEAGRAAIKESDGHLPDAAVFGDHEEEEEDDELEGPGLAVSFGGLSTEELARQLVEERAHLELLEGQLAGEAHVKR